MSSIEDALLSVSQPGRDSLLRIVDIARRVAPDAEDGVSYGMPAQGQRQAAYRGDRQRQAPLGLPVLP
jgi:hypothetical protein